MSVKDEINKLKKEIERHNFLYHSENNPEISDAEYDALYQRLKSLESDQVVSEDSPTKTVGSKPSKYLSVILSPFSGMPTAGFLVVSVSNVKKPFVVSTV